MVLLDAILLFLGALGLLLFTCEMGHRFRDAFSDMNDALGQLNFYLFPIDIQRILPTVIMYAQEPLNVGFFGSLSATREQFKQVSAPIKSL